MPLLKRYPLFLFLLTLATLSATAQDSTKISLPNAEARFLSNYLPSLARKFNLDIAKAQEIQARLWDNPTVRYEQNLYNRDRRIWFDGSDKGQNAIEIDQLIRLGGKINKQLKVAKAQTQLTEYDYLDFLRTMRFDLRSTFLKLASTLETIRIYDREIAELAILVKAFESQFQKGNIPLRDISRLRTQLFTLRSERLDLNQVYIDLQSHFSLLMGEKESKNWIPDFNLNQIKTVKTADNGIKTLTDSALLKRPDLKYYQSNLDLLDAQIQLQQSLAIPDLNLGYLYDKQGSYQRDYNAVALGMTLPFFNRNQGAIKGAKIQRKQAEILLEYYQSQLLAELNSAYKRSLETEKTFFEFDQSYVSTVDKLLETFSENFGKRNISMIEYFDFLDSYKESLSRYYQLAANRLILLEELNFKTASQIYEIK